MTHPSPPPPPHHRCGPVSLCHRLPSLEGSLSSWSAAGEEVGIPTPRGIMGDFQKEELSLEETK